jgi:hypothetical protein
MRASVLALGFAMLLAGSSGAAGLSAVVEKRSVDVYAEPRLDAARVATLKRDARVEISTQQGLWYQVKAASGAAGFVRVNDLRVAYAGQEGADAALRALTEGRAGAGRVTETAGVRGIDESDLRSAAFDAAQLSAMIGNRVAAADAAAYAAAQGRQQTTVAYAGEARPLQRSDAADAATPRASAAAARSAFGGLLGSLGLPSSPRLEEAIEAAPESDEEVAAEERALGPEIAGRILGARPLWTDAAAQQRVNLVGRWLASQTSRPELPWSFGVIDTPELNAFAAPGGFILVTRGLYQLLSSDGEVAAVLGHEISHCVQSDHYNVIRKQEVAARVKDRALEGAARSVESDAAASARRYVEEHGAAVMLTSLDREAEYRADEAAEIYLARAGMNPLALYAVLQKMTALGQESAALAQLYKTHPALDARMDRIDQRGYGTLGPYLSRE